jgi:hypothetical protein
MAGGAKTLFRRFGIDVENIICRIRQGHLPEISQKIALKEFIDHGSNTQPNQATDAFLQGGYKDLYSKTKHTGQNRATRSRSRD